MIRVITTDNKSPEIYKTGTKFAIDQVTRNLHVYNDSNEEIAVHADGTWASVSVDNSQKHADKLTPEMVSGEWPTIFDDSSVYDCSGITCIGGVTNFCINTISQALAGCKLPAHREDLTLLIDISLYNRLEDRYELNRKPDGTQWKRFNVEINPVDQDVSKPFLETLIRHKSGKTIKLITREF